LLHDTGEATSLDGRDGPVDTRNAQLIALSRGLTRFQLFRTPPGLSGARADKAALLFAEAHAPFTQTESVLRRRPDAIAIWQWDAEQVRMVLGETRYNRDRLVPETLLQTPGDGWRQVATSDGFEAQYWEEGELRASSWRRRAFTQESWSAFALSVEEPARPVPRDAPGAITVRLDPNAPWRRGRVRAALGWREIEVLGLSAALCAGAVAAVFAGQALHYQRLAAAEAEVIAAERAAEAATPEAAKAAADLALLHAYEAARPKSNALAVAADAFAVFDNLGLTVTAWRVDGSQFRAEIAAMDPSNGLEDLAAALERAPTLRNVAPQFDGAGGGVIVTADVVAGVEPRT
jgi:hypothetical protein